MERRRGGRHCGRPHDPLPRRVRVRVGQHALSAHDRDRARDLRRAARDLPDRVLQHRDEAVARPVGQGDGEVRHPLSLPRRRCRLSRTAFDGVLLALHRCADARADRERHLRRAAAARRTRRREPRLPGAGAAHRGDWQTDGPRAALRSGCGGASSAARSV